MQDSKSSKQFKADETGHNPGFVPVQKKKVEEKKEMEEKIIELTTPSMIPVNQRIYCERVEIDDEDTRIITKSGVELWTPTGYKKPTSEKEYQDIKFFRYYVVAAAEDCPHIMVDGKAVKISKGMEIYKYIPDSSISYDDVMVRDWKTKKDYVSIHFTEVSGIDPNIMRVE